MSDKMKVISSSVFLSILAVSLINCNEPKNMDELDNAEDWEGISNAICKKDHPKNVKEQIEKCNQLDPYYKLDNLMKQCDKLRAPHGSPWYEEERGECSYNECFIKLNGTTEFQKLSQESESMSDSTEAKKAYEKYKCIRKALGLKV